MCKRYIKSYECKLGFVRCVMVLLWCHTHTLAPVIGLQPGSDRSGAVLEDGGKKEAATNLWFVVATFYKRCLSAGEQYCKIL